MVTLQDISHPLTVNSFFHWVRLLRLYGCFDAKHFIRGACITVVSPFAWPARFRERLFYDKRVRSVEITQPPVFIIGHWRSGTTHLHNLMSQDPNLGYVSTFDVMVPTASISGYYTLRPLAALFIPKTRPMDNVAVTSSTPQEEEFYLANACPHSFYLGIYFPRHVRELFRKYGLFEGVSDQEFEEWRDTYVELMKKATFKTGGKRIVLKNPVNTARPLVVRKVFPGAKFVHIYRNPYEVFRSAIKLGHAMRQWWAVQSISDAQIEENVLLFYREMMTRFFEQKDAIPNQDLVEVRFEDLDRQPVKELARIYEQLGLPGWDEARGPIEAYAASQAGYQKNRFPLSEEDIAKVEQHWQFAVDRWGYERPVPRA